MISNSNNKYAYEKFLEIIKDIERVEFIDGDFTIYNKAVVNSEIFKELIIPLENIFE